MAWGKRKSKFNAVPVVADGHRFASKAEHARYLKLKLLQRAGQISDLELHPKYALGVNGLHICHYIADFRYRENGLLVVEDSKSPATLTPECKIKLKLMKGCHGIDVLLTGAIAKDKAPVTYVSRQGQRETFKKRHSA